MPAPSTEPVRALFTRIARIYDRLNRVLTFGADTLWRRRALARLARALPDPSAGLDILDLATGTGDLARAALRRFPRARVTGLDLTPAMLAVARAKLAAPAAAGRLALTEGDAQNLPFADAAFDAVTCAFGFRNFPDPARALAEAARVLRPGGRLLVLEFFRPEHRTLDLLTSAWLRLAPALFARAARADYAYLRASIARARTVSGFLALARAAGFTPRSRAFFLPACTCLLLDK